MAPTWAMTVTRPPAWSSTTSTTARRSSGLIAANSPVEPHGTRPWAPAEMVRSMSSRRRGSSTSESGPVNGVTTAERTPAMSDTVCSFDYCRQPTLNNKVLTRGTTHRISAPPRSRHRWLTTARRPPSGCGPNPAPKGHGTYVSYWDLIPPGAGAAAAPPSRQPRPTETGGREGHGDYWRHLATRYRFVYCRQ